MFAWPSAFYFVLCRENLIRKNILPDCLTLWYKISLNKYLKRPFYFFTWYIMMWMFFAETWNSDNLLIFYDFGFDANHMSLLLVNGRILHFWSLFDKARTVARLTAKQHTFREIGTPSSGRTRDILEKRSREQSPPNRRSSVVPAVIVSSDWSPVFLPYFGFCCFSVWFGLCPLNDPLFCFSCWSVSSIYFSWFGHLCFVVLQLWSLLFSFLLLSLLFLILFWFLLCPTF